MFRASFQQNIQKRQIQTGVGLAVPGTGGKGSGPCLPNGDGVFLWRVLKRFKTRGSWWWHESVNEHNCALQQFVGNYIHVKWRGLSVREPVGSGELLTANRSPLLPHTGSCSGSAALSGDRVGPAG